MNLAKANKYRSSPRYGYIARHARYAIQHILLARQ